jgi:SAM-dependent methyltransferase
LTIDSITDGPGVASINRSTWSRPDTLELFVGTEGWQDAGERASLVAVAPKVRGGRLLDVGVGGGRTVSLLKLLSDDYVGVDYTPEMVELCRRQHPDVDIRVGDARDLGDFADSTFAFAFFSWNGIDAVDHDDRLKILHELARVVRPGGYLLFSSHNREGFAYGQAPWRRMRASGSRVHRFLRFVARLPRNAPGYVRRWPNWLRNRRLHKDNGDWAIHSTDAHDFGIVVFFTTMRNERRELEAAGFEDTVVFASTTGERFVPGADTSTADHLYFLARRAG